MRKERMASVLFMATLVSVLSVGLLAAVPVRAQEKPRWRFTLYVLTFSSPGQTEYRLCEITKAQWAKIGVNLEIVPIDPTKFWSMIFVENRSYNPDTGEGWDLAMAQYTNNPYEPDLESGYVSYTAPWGPKSGINFATWKNGLADYWLQKAMMEFDEEKRTLYFSNWQKEYVWDSPMIDLVSESAPLPMRKDIILVAPSADPGYVIPRTLKNLKVEGKTASDNVEITACSGGGNVGNVGDTQLPWWMWGGRERLYQWDGLIEMEYEGGQWKVAPSLAESWDLDQEKKTITFHLRRGVTWHDGEKFDAEDVMWSYQVMMDPDTRSARAGDLTTWMSKVEKIDDYTVKFYMNRFAPGMYGVCFDSIWTPIGPSHFFKDVPLKDLVNDPAIIWKNPIPGTGAFVLKEIGADKTFLIYEANKDYFKGAPLVDKLIIRMIDSPATALIALEKGEIDMIINSQYAMNIIDDLKGIESKYPNLKVQYETSCTQRTFYTNDLNPYLSNRLVRRALIMATDRNEIINTVYAGTGSVGRGPITPGMKFYDTNLEPLPYDPAEAQRILDSVGLEMPPEPEVLPDALCE